MILIHFHVIKQNTFKYEATIGWDEEDATKRWETFIQKFSS